jgi:hypothetical protein
MQLHEKDNNMDVFFWLQRNSQSKKEDNDDDDTLKHVVYVFCFVPA